MLKKFPQKEGEGPPFPLFNKVQVNHQGRGASCLDPSRCSLCRRQTSFTPSEILPAIGT